MEKKNGKTMKGLPISERPYEKVLEKGPASLSDAELLSVILRSGTKNIPVREMAAEAGVNPNTMQRALAQLENEGLVRTERTAGRYVTEDRALIEQLRAEAARNLTAEFLEKMRGIGYGPEQAAALLERWNEKEGTNHD